MSRRIPVAAGICLLVQEDGKGLHGDLSIRLSDAAGRDIATMPLTPAQAEAFAETMLARARAILARRRAIAIRSTQNDPALP